MVAGSEGSGFWFELKTDVRGSSAALHPGVNPSELPLQYFVGNVAHSNGSGMKTYPGAGYNSIEEAAFIDSKMYHNRGSGIFLHNSGHFLIQGGIFADNRIGVDVDRAQSLRIIGSKFIGVTPSFAALVSSSGKRGHCSPVSSSMMMNYPVLGVELHSSRQGGTKVNGVVLEDLSFVHFGKGTQCPGSSALGVDPKENFGFFDPRHSAKGLTFDADTSKLNLCKAVARGINLAIEDKDASIGSSTGFIVSSNSNMTTFSSCTAVSDVSCASACTIKLINQDGSAYICVQGSVAYNSSPCPVAWLRSRVGTTNPVDSYLTIATDIITSSTGEWDTMVGTFIVTEAQVNAGSVLLAWHRTPAHVKVILDNITLSCVSGCDETTRSLRGVQVKQGRINSKLGSGSTAFSEYH